MQDFRTPPHVIDHLKKWEGFRSEWYGDGGGTQTIGHGTTKSTPTVRAQAIETPITRDRAEELLLTALRHYYEPGVIGALRAPIVLDDEQIGALVSFAYNVGLPSFTTSTLLLRINEGKALEAAQEFGKWIYVNGEPWHGLKRRRKAERNLFLGKRSAAEAIEPKLIPAEPPVKLKTKALGEMLPGDSMKGPRSKLQRSNNPRT